MCASTQRNSTFLYISEAPLNHAFLQGISLVIANDWRDVAYAFQLSRSEVKQIGQRQQAPEEAAQEMLLTVERNFKEKDKPGQEICLNTLLQTFKKTGMLKEQVDKISTMFYKG